LNSREKTGRTNSRVIAYNFDIKPNVAIKGERQRVQPGLLRRFLIALLAYS
jgi:hypothetical protein